MLFYMGKTGKSGGVSEENRTPNLRIRPHCSMRMVAIDAGHSAAVKGDPGTADKAPVEELMA